MDKGSGSRQTASGQGVSRNLRAPFLHVYPNTKKSIRERMCFGGRERDLSKET